MAGPPARVWVISELYYPETTSTGYFLTGIAESLAAARDVHVLCAQPTYSARGGRAPKTERRAGVTIVRCGSTTFPKDVLALRLVNAFSFSASVFGAAVRQFRRGDVAIVVTNPPILPFVISWAARLRGVRPVLLVHDVYPEVATATGLLRPGGWQARLLGRLTRRLYARMDRIVVLGRDMEALIARKLGRAGPTRIIPNWGDVDRVRPMPVAARDLRQSLGLDGKFVVQLLGNLGRTHGVEVIVEAARRLAQRADVHFLVVGWGARRAWLEQQVAAGALPNVTVRPPCSAEELPAYLNACDLAAVAFLPGMAGVSVPSRLYNVMAAGKPVLAVADPDSELALVVREEGAGWVVPPADPDAVVAAIERAVSSPQILATMGARARRAAETKYSQARVGSQYAELLAEMDRDAPPRGGH